MIFGMQVGAGNSEVNFNDKRVFIGFGLIMNNGDVSSDDVFHVVLQVTDFFGNIGVEGGGHLDVARTDVNLHETSLNLKSLGQKAKMRIVVFELLPVGFYAKTHHLL